MSVIQTKSISGITSITTPSGGDNLLTIHTSDTTERVRVNNSGDVIVGTGLTLSPDGNITAGIITATTIGAGTSMAAAGLTGALPSISGANLTGLTQTTINTNANNRVITGSDTANTLNGESNVNIDGGIILVGHTASTPTSDGETPFIQVKSTDSRGGASFLRHSANASGGGLYIGKSRNATIGSNTIVQDGDELGRITFSGDDGTDINTVAAKIASYVNGTPGSNDMPGSLRFYTTADGAAAATERLRIDSSGVVHLKSSTSAQNTTTELRFSPTTSTNRYATVQAINNSGNNHIDLQFFTSNADTPAERLRIDATGSIGVNETSPSFSGFGSNGGGIELDDVNSGFTAVKISHGSADMYLASVGSAGYISTRTNHEIVVEKNSAEVARFTDNGLKVPSGKGIDFSSSSNSGGMTSELFDDYEEGTSNCAFQGAEGGNTSLSNAIRYTKIGDWVFICFTKNNFSNGGVGGTLELSMPFTSSNADGSSEWYGSDTYYYPTNKWDTYTDFTGLTPYIQANSTSCKFRVKIKDGDRQTIVSAGNNNQISGATGLYLRFALAYRCA